jgi:hypothetical protein
MPNDLEVLRRLHLIASFAALVLAPGALIGLQVWRQRIGDRISDLKAAKDRARADSLRNDLQGTQADLQTTQEELGKARRSQAAAESAFSELKQKTAPRRLVDPERLTALLRSAPCAPVRVLASSIDPEATAFAADLASAIQAAGWPVARPANVLLPQPGTGAAVFVRDMESQPGAHLQKALRDCRIKTGGGLDPNPEHVILVVGARP